MEKEDPSTRPPPCHGKIKCVRGEELYEEQNGGVYISPGIVQSTCVYSYVHNLYNSWSVGANVSSVVSL